MGTLNAIIVGAGPAGCITALRLGQLGIREVVLVDRDDFPREKTCGSGISPKGIQLLQQLGLWEEIEPEAYPIKGLRLVTPKGKELLLSDGRTAAVICKRRHFDYVLLRRAQALGVRFEPHFLVRELIEESGRVVGCRAADGRTLHARFTVIANGAHSLLSGREEPKQLLQAIMGWWEGVPHTEYFVEMVFDPLVKPWYGWLFPESESVVNIGICYRDAHHEKNARQLFQRFLDGQYAERLLHARSLGAWKGHPISYSYAIRNLYSPGRLVVGEAGRITHPATAEGIFQGMATGVMAAEAIETVVRGEQDEAAAFAAYERRCRRRFLPSFWGAKVFQGWVNTPAFDGMVSLAGRLRRNAEPVAAR